MSQNRFAMGFAFAALFAGFAFMAGYTSNAPVQPAVVAFVDLEYLFNNLSSREATETRLQNMATEMQGNTTAMQEELELLQAELESLEPGSDAMAELTDRAIGISGRLRAYDTYANLILERERATDLRETYDRIRDEAGKLSEKLKIDIVLLNDSIPQIDLSDAARTLQQISARRILYANQQLDITEELLAQMNSASSG